MVNLNALKTFYVCLFIDWEHAEPFQEEKREPLPRGYKSGVVQGGFQ